jgi:hypothetical protein
LCYNVCGEFRRNSLKHYCHISLLKSKTNNTNEIYYPCPCPIEAAECNNVSQ